MGTFLGKEGQVELAGGVIAEVRNFKISIAAAKIDAAAMGHNGWENFRPGMKNWSAEISGFYDSGDTTGQQAVSVGDEITAALYPEGNTTGLQHYNGNAMVEMLDIDQAHDGLVEFTMKVQGNGVLNIEDVA